MFAWMSACQRGIKKLSGFNTVVVESAAERTGLKLEAHLLVADLKRCYIYSAPCDTCLSKDSLASANWMWGWL